MDIARLGRRWWIVAALYCAVVGCDEGRRSRDRLDVIIRNGRVLDGSGNPWFRADIGIRGDRIVALGTIVAPSEKEIDATGLYVTPGFIDAHSHAAEGLATPERSKAVPLLAQGLTTVVINPDGSGPVDLAGQRDSLLEDGLGINVAQLVPHGSIRLAVLGMADRRATDDELARMSSMVRRGMEEGAFGLSSGPFYAPGSFADTGELIALGGIASAYRGIYTSHIRDESNYTIGVVAAVDELIAVARGAGLPAVVTHIKALGPPVWGTSQTIVNRINEGRRDGLELYADQYPYAASATGLGSALLPRWAMAGGRDSLEDRLDDPVFTGRIRAAMLENLARRGGADRIRFRYVTSDSTLEGRALSDVAASWNVLPVDAAWRIIRSGYAGIVSFNMDEGDVRRFMSQPWTMTSSDGSYRPWGEGVPHPRDNGSFPRKIRHYVLEEGVISLQYAVRSMTALPAQVFRLADRGVIREGAYADVAVFDLATIRDHATYEEPFQMADGMVYLLVNGRLAIDNGVFTGSLSGRILQRDGGRWAR